VFSYVRWHMQTQVVNGVIFRPLCECCPWH